MFCSRVELSQKNEKHFMREICCHSLTQKLSKYWQKQNKKGTGHSGANVVFILVREMALLA
jgi:hypothetical protein